MQTLSDKDFRTSAAKTKKHQKKREVPDYIELPAHTQRAQETQQNSASSGDPNAIVLPTRAAETRDTLQNSQAAHKYVL